MDWKTLKHRLTHELHVFHHFGHIAYLGAVFWQSHYFYGYIAGGLALGAIILLFLGDLTE